jgi:hypothetical protein
MKFAPALVVGTLGGLLLTMALAKAPNPPTIEVPLDMRGVRIVEVRSHDQVEITIAAGKSDMRYPDSTDTHVKARRDGERLIINADLDGWEAFRVTVPPDVHRFFVDGGSIGTKLELTDIEILSPGDVTWKGDAKLLVLRDTSDPSKHRNDARERGDDCGCGRHSTLTVEGGEIAEVRAYSPHATLKLGDADKLGAVYAWLGPKGTVTIENARSFHQVHVLSEGEPLPAATASPTVPR